VVTDDPHHALTNSTALRLLTVAATLVVAATVVACGDGAEPTATTRLAPTASTTTTTALAPSPTSPAPGRSDLQTVLDRGASFVTRQFASIDIASGSLFEYLHRRWEITGLADAGQAVQKRLSTASLDEEELLLMRLADPAAPPVPVPADTEPTTAVIAPATQCDRVPLTDGDVTRLGSLVAGGGYETTHAGLAIGFMVELGCEIPADIRQNVLDSMADELGKASASEDPPTDLAAEQSAILSYLGAPQLIPVGWYNRLLDTQRSDGGWGPAHTPSTWHMTLLAMWTLAANSSPGNPVGIIAPR